MSMTGVLRPGHCLLRVLDIEAAVKHYTEVIGLDITGRDDKGRVYLKAWDELDHHSIILREADIPGCDFIAFKVDSKATLERLAKDVEKFGCKVNYLPAGELMETGERVRFQIPTGHHVELYAEKTKVGNGLGNVNPAPWPDGLHGMQPPRMDHWQIHGIELPGSVELFTKVLGFGWTERVKDDNTLMAAFLSCSTKPHDIALGFRCRGVVRRIGPRRPHPCPAARPVRGPPVRCRVVGRGRHRRACGDGPRRRPAPARRPAGA